MTMAMTLTTPTTTTMTTKVATSTSQGLRQLRPQRHPTAPARGLRRRDGARLRRVVGLVLGLVVAVRAMLERALGRAAYADEVERLAALVASERARYAGRDELARTLAGRAAEGSADLARDAALVAAANVILNLDDFLTRS
jgi:hypothetical protein